MLRCLLLSLLALHVSCAPDSSDWNWSPTSFVPAGPEYWPGVCQTGQEQSPIDVPAFDLTFVEGPPVRDMIINSGYATFAVTQSHGVPLYSCFEADGGTACGSIDVGGIEYRLAQFHFHAPSENRIDGITYALELHLVHCTGNCVPGEDNFAVVGILFDLDFLGDDNPVLSELWAFADDEEGYMNVDIWSIAQIDSSTYNWKGSLTTPSCIEGLSWTLLKEATPVSLQQYEQFANKVAPVGNARPVQPLFGRTIYNSPGGWLDEITVESDVGSDDSNNDLSLIDIIIADDKYSYSYDG